MYPWLHFSKSAKFEKNRISWLLLGRENIDFHCTTAPVVGQHHPLWGGGESLRGRSIKRPAPPHQLNTRIKTISTQHWHKPNNISNNTNNSTSIATTEVPGSCSTMCMWISFSVWHRGGLLSWHNLQCCVLGPLTRLYNVHWTPPAPHTHITDTCHAASINWYLSIWIFLWTRHFLIGNNSYVLGSSNTKILLEWRAADKSQLLRVMETLLDFQRTVRCNGPWFDRRPRT